MPRPQRVWYGWQTLAADAAAISLVYAGSQGGADVVTGAGAFTYAFGGPVVHGMHQQTPSAIASFGVRVGVPLAAFLLASPSKDESCSGSESECQPEYERAFAWALAGVAFASLFDAAVLAHEHERPARGARVAPSLALGRSGAAIGVIGSF